MIFTLMYKKWKIYSLVVLCSLLMTRTLSAQDKFTFPQTSDIGLNITNVLTSFIGNSNSNASVETFPFVAKVNRKKGALRIGVGFNLKNSDETLTDVEQVIFNNFQVRARVGYERKKYLGNRFGFFYGIDLVSSMNNEESIFSNDIDITNLSSNTIGVGGGPVYGFEYYINKYIYLGTEGNFYGIYNIKTEKETFKFSPENNATRQTSGFQANISVPIHLYIMVRF